VIEAISPVTPWFCCSDDVSEMAGLAGSGSAKFQAQIATIRTQLSLPWPTIVGDAATILFYLFVYTRFLLPPFLAEQFNGRKWLNNAMALSRKEWLWSPDRAGVGVTSGGAAA
jgi:hypothetical protein